MQTVIPKSASYSFHSSQTDNLSATWGFGADMIYSRKARGKPTTSADEKFYTSTVSLNGSGEMLRVGFDVSIDGRANSMQQISINTLLGRVIV